MTRLRWRSRSGAAERLSSRHRTRRRPGLLLAALTLLVVLAGGPLPAQEEGAGTTMLFGVVGFYNPRLLYLKYQPLVDYLAESSGRDWELEIYTTYDDTVDDLCAGRLAAAYLGPLTYVRAHAQCGALPVVRLNTGDSPTIESFVMVRNDSAITSIEELKGKRFGFGSPLSTTSHLAPRNMLEEAGLRPGLDFECHYFEHHEKAARAVLLGQVDACGVRDTVGRRFQTRGLRLLARSAPITNFPIVVPAGLADSVGAELVATLVEAPREDAALVRRMLAWDDELSAGFRIVEDADYEPVREMARRVLGPEALTMGADATRCAP